MNDEALEVRGMGGGFVSLLPRKLHSILTARVQMSLHTC